MTPSRKKFLSPDVLAKAAVQLASMAKDEGAKIALVGGFAMQIYGSDRLTGDIDVAAYERLNGLPRGKPLSFGGEQTKAPNGVPVDVVVRDDEYAGLYEEAVAQAQRDRELGGMLVARPEHLAAMKMVAGRTRDLGDLEFLIESGVLDLKRARSIIARHLGVYAAGEFDALVDEIRWKASRRRRTTRRR